jgi:hypothetical protein
MLIRLSAVFSMLTLAVAGAAFLGPAAASAAPCRLNVCPGGNSVSVIAHGKRTKPGRKGGGGTVLGNAPTGPNLGCPNLPGGAIGSGCVPGAPGPAAVPVRDPALVAADARDQLVLPPPGINTSPSPRTYVQKLRTGLWVTRAFHVFKAEARDPLGVETVVATATPQGVTWNLVEETVTCDGPGSPNNTACGHTFQRSSAAQPNGKYHISATVTWRITWACTQGCTATGVLPDMPMTSFLDLPVLEIQTESHPG